MHDDLNPRQGDFMIDGAQGDLAAETGSQPVAQDLDTIITDAIARTEVDPTAAGDGAKPAGDKPRDAQGRFAPSNSAPDASREGAPDGAQPAKTDAASKPADAQPLEPPARWSDADKAKFAAWPRDVQESVLERHKAMEADYTRKTQEASDLRRQAEPLLHAVQPFQQYLTELSPRIGVAPGEMIRGLLQTEYTLRNGTPQQKAQALQEIVQTYGIDLAAPNGGQPGQPDSAISHLHQQISHLTQRLSAYERQSSDESSRQLQATVDAFSSERHPDGTPKRPHFERFKGVMAHLLETRQASTLDEAYQLATEPLRAALADELSQRQTTLDQQRRDAVDKARRAAPPPRSGSQPNGSTAAGSGLDALLSQAIAKAGIG
jgi:hypothetical protein